jgi:hypothetical protein
MNYKDCEYYSEKEDDLFDNDPVITVIGCKVYGIKPLCIHDDLWKNCLVSRNEAFYLYRYRSRTKIAMHAQLRTPYDRDPILTILRNEMKTYTPKRYTHCGEYQ